MKRSRIRRVSEKQRQRTMGLEELRDRVFSDCNGRCARCHVRYAPHIAFDLHHLLSRARGGEDTPENLVLLCRSCHNAVTDHTCPDWQNFTRSANGR